MRSLSVTHVPVLCLFLALLVSPAASVAQQSTSAPGQSNRQSQRRIPPAPQLSAYSFSTDQPQLTQNGTALIATDVEVQGPLGTVLFPVLNDGFTADFDLVTNTVNQFFLTSIASDGERSATAAVSITRDNEDPTVFIDFPGDGDELTTPTIDVAGRMGDHLSGLEGLVVTINGLLAQMDAGIGQNGTFVLQNLALNPVGIPTIISALATDVFGNQVLQVVNVTQIAIPPGSPEIHVSSGDQQQGTVDTLLPLEAVVSVTRADGSAFEGKLVSFEVTRSNGLLSETLGGPQSNIVQATSDANGLASVFWQMGSDSGCGNNRIAVTSTDVVGSTFFCASAAHAPASRITVSTGNNQIAEVQSPVSLPLRVWASDGSNGVEGVPLVFSVVEGGGLVNGQSQVTIPSVLTGHAEVQYRLGSQPGLNRVEVDFMGNSGLPAVFQATALEREDHVPTSFHGRVVDDAARPIEGVRIVMTLGVLELPEMFTDGKGEFFFNDLPQAGPAQLLVDGSTATGVGGEFGLMEGFPALRFVVNLIQNSSNSLPTPVMLPPLDPVNQVVFDNSFDFNLSITGVAGVEMLVRAGSVTLADGTVPDASNPVTLSLDQVDFDEIPMPLPDGASPPFAWTLQPAGTRFDPPVAVTLPNMVGLAPGAIVYIQSFNHSTLSFDVVASGSVSGDGALITSDPGTGISVSGWGGFCPPYSPHTTGSGEPEISAWAGSSDFFLSYIRFLRLTQGPCEFLLDGTAAGYTAYRACVQDAAACSSNVTQNALGVRGTVIGPQLPALDTITDFAKQELQTILDDTFGVGPAPGQGPGGAVILSQRVLDVPIQVPSSLVNWTARVFFPTPPAGLSVGDGVQLTDLTAFGFGPHAALTLTVTAVENPSQAIVSGFLIETLQPPRVTARIGNQIAAVLPDGSFTITNIPVNTGAPLRPQLFFEGVGVQRVVVSEFYQAGVIGGTTAFGPISLDMEALLPVSIDIVSPLPVFTEPLQTSQLQVLATMTDDSVLDVTPFASGTRYTSSNPAIVQVDSGGLLSALDNGEALISVSNEGTTAVISVLVSLGDPLTTVEGFVTLENGTIVGGATVTVNPGNLVGTTDTLLGRFSIPGVPALLGDLTVIVDAQAGPAFLTGTVTGIEPVPDAMTDAGVIRISDAVFWKDDISGSWNNPARWNTGAVPGPTDDVVIDRTAGDFTINLGGATAIVNSLRCEEQLVVDSGSLRVTQPYQVNNIFSLSGGTLSDSRLLPGLGDLGLNVTGGVLDAMTFEAPLRVTAGNTTILGALTINGSASLAGGTLVGGSVAGTAPLLVSGTSTLDSVTLDTDVQVADGGHLELQNSLILNSALALGSSAGATLLYNAATTLGGTGTLSLVGTGSSLEHASAGSVLTIDAGVVVDGQGTIGNAGGSWINRGTIRGNGNGALMFGGDGYQNEGLIEVGATGSTLDFGGTNWLNSGSIQGAPGKSMTVAGTAWTNTATGTISVTDGALTLGGTYSQDGTVTATESILNLGGNFALANLGTISVSGGPVNLTGTLTNNALVGLDVGTFGVQWRLAGGTIIGGSVNGVGPMLVTANSLLDGVRLDTAMLVSDDVQLEMQNNLTLNGDLTIGGNTGATLAYSGSQILDGTGSLHLPLAGSVLQHNTASALLTIESGVVIDGQGVVGSTGGSWINRGTIRGNASGVLTLAGDAYRNEGLIEVTATGSTISFGGTGWSNMATIRGASGKSLNLAGSGWMNESLGTISVFDGTVTMGGTYSHSGSISASNSVVNLGGSFTLSNLGSFSVSGGPVNLTGALTNNAAGGLDIGAQGVEWRLLGGTIIGGSIVGTGPLMVNESSTLDGVTLDTDVQVADGVALLIENNLTLNTTLTLGAAAGATLAYAGPQVIDGVGVVQMSSVGSTLGETTGGGVLTLESGITVEGHGSVGSAGGSWINRGTLRNNSAEAMSFAGDGYRNEGLIEATPTGSALSFGGAAWQNAGTILAASGKDVSLTGAGWTNEVGSMISVSDATISLAGTYSQAGDLSATNSVVNLGGNFTLLNLGMFNVTGGPVNLTGSLTNSAPGGLDIGALGVEWRLVGGTIIGGSVNGAGPLMVNADSTLDGVTLDTDTQVADGVVLALRNDLTLNSNLSLGTGTGATLAYDGSQILGGTGAVHLAGASSAVSHGAGGGVLTIDSGVVIDGQGSVGSAGGSWINRGTIRGDAGGGLALAGDNYRNEGLIEVSATGSTITFGGTGWSNMATISAASGKSLTLAGSGWSNSMSGTISVADGFVTLGGTFLQDGALTATNSVVNLGGSFELLHLGNFVVTGGPVNLTGTLINNAVGGLDIGGFGVEWRLLGGTIIGGSVNGTGPLMVNADSSLEGVTLDTDAQVADGVELSLRSDLTLNSNLTLGSLSGATLVYDGTQSLTGTGSVHLPIAGSLVRHAAPGDVLTIETGVVIDGQGVVGSAGGSWVNRGTIRGNASGSLTLAGDGYVNEGLVEVTAAGSEISFEGTGWSNRATIQAASGKNLMLNGSGWMNLAPGTISVVDGIATLGGSYSHTGALTATNSVVNLGGNFVLTDLGVLSLTGGALNQTGVLTNSAIGGLDVDAFGTPWSLAGGTIIGGSVNGTGPMQVTANSTLDGVTLDVDARVADSVELVMENNLTVNSTLALGVTTDGKLLYSGSQILDGTGMVLLTNGSSGLFDALPGSFLLIESGILLEGCGGLGIPQGGSSWTNRGTIRNNTAVSLSLTGQSYLNEGLIEANSSGSVLVSGVGVNAGTLSICSTGEIGGTGPITQTAAGLFRVDIAGVAPPIVGRLSLFGGNIALDGTVEVRPVGGYVPTPGDSAIILETFGPISGTFATENCVGFNCLMDYSTGSSVVVRVVP